MLTSFFFKNINSRQIGKQVTLRKLCDIVTNVWANLITDNTSKISCLTMKLNDQLETE